MIAQFSRLDNFNMISQERQERQMRLKAFLSKSIIQGAQKTTNISARRQHHPKLIKASEGHYSMMKMIMNKVVFNEY